MDIKKSGDTTVADAIEAEFDGIKDPCMQAAGLDLSLIDLGLIRSIDVTKDSVAILVGLTEPGCGFTHVVAHGIRQAAGRHAGSRRIEIGFEWRDLWTEEHMKPEAREAFARSRSALADRLRGRGSRHSAPSDARSVK